MQRFVQLFTELDQTTRVNDKIDALVRYFHDAQEEDMLWTIALLSHRRPKRTVTTSLLREWAAEAAGIPLWLFEESYHIVGDLAETISLVLPSPVSANPQSLSYWINFIRNLGGESEIQRKVRILGAWEQMEAPERFLFNKLITGGLGFHNSFW